MRILCSAFKKSIFVAILITGMSLLGRDACAQATQATGSGTFQITRVPGTIKSVGADSLTVTSDTGADVKATLSSSTKILRVPPGEKDLKNAVPLAAGDLQPGDRALVRGTVSPDGHGLVALAVIVMQQSDVSAKQQRDREDWQMRGVGGLVGTVDPAVGTITIAASGSGGNRNIILRTTKKTVLRRYAANSIKFDNAHLSPLSEVHSGDQLRARGARSADGTELAAEEIVSGTFRNIVGTITAIDTAANSITVQDAIRKIAAVVKISSDSQMKKLPTEMAQRIATRMKAEAGPAGGPGSAPSPQETVRADSQASRAPGGTQSENGGPPDLQRFLSRIPNSKLTDLQKGDAVMIVSTDGGDTAPSTAITLLAGVEPILAAAPSRNAAAILSPWSLGGAGGEGENAP